MHEFFMFNEKLNGTEQITYEVSMCPACRTVNVKSICPASVNHVSYRFRSRGFSSWSTVAGGADSNSDIPRQSA